MSYIMTTRKRVEDFIRKKKETYQTEVQCLGKDKPQINLRQVKEILADLVAEGKITVEIFKAGKTTMTNIHWR